MVDAQDLKSCELQHSCRFKSGLRHHLEEYPSLVEGTGLENRKVAKAAQGFKSLFLRHYIAGWSSLVARWAHNPKVRGSNPLPATNLVPWCSWLTRLPVTQKIAGSSPVGTAIWLHSSVGRAFDLDSEGHEFASHTDHHVPEWRNW